MKPLTKLGADALERLHKAAYDDRTQYHGDPLEAALSGKYHPALDTPAPHASGQRAAAGAAHAAPAAAAGAGAKPGFMARLRGMFGKKASAKYAFSVTPEGQEKIADALQRNLMRVAQNEGLPAAVDLYNEVRRHAPHLRRVGSFAEAELRPGFNRSSPFRPFYDDRRSPPVDILEHRIPGSFAEGVAELRAKGIGLDRVAMPKHSAPDLPLTRREKLYARYGLLGRLLGG